jgi:L-threonylcarbamoyladenylate synthase
MGSAYLSQIFAMDDQVERRAGLAAAVAALARGSLVAMPTETVYGLAADATNPAAVAGIFAAKARPRFNPLIIHVESLAAAERLAVFPESAHRLAAAFWPGPLSQVLPLRQNAPVADLVTAGLDTVAIRVPAHPVAHELLQAFGRPLAAPSANRSGHVSPTTAAHVAADLGEQVAVILDAGPTPIGLESTIVGFEGDLPVLLRTGGLDRAAIEAVLGRSFLFQGADANTPRAPGMLASHYAPAASLRLDVDEVRPGEALLAFGPTLPGKARDAVALRNLSETGNLAEAAANLFAALRALDGEGRTIAVMPIPAQGLGEAINDRLRRAAAPRS